MVSYYYENISSISSKFWKITPEKDNSATVNWGRIGSNGSSRNYPFSSKKEMMDFVNKKKEEKTIKGYKLVKQASNKSLVKKKIIIKKKTPAKKTSVKKTPAKKTPAKKTPAKKTPAKKTPAKKTPAKKTPAKKTSAKKTPAKKTPAKKTPAKKTPAKKKIIIKKKTKEKKALNNNFIKQKIELVPQMFDNNKVMANTTEALVLASKHKKQLLAWYKKMSNLNIYIKDPRVSMDTNGVIIIEYIIDKELLEDFFPDFVTDPDDDGNHPIKKYLVTKFKFSVNKKLLLTKVIKENYINTLAPKKMIKKTPAKKKIIIKKKIPAKKRNESYDEEWATTPDKYTLGVPSKAQLVRRKQMISEIYKMHKEIKKLDEDSIGAVNPEEWRTPPEYCDEDELNGMFLLLKEDLKNLKPSVKKSSVKKQSVKVASPKTIAKKTSVKSASTLGKEYKAMWDVKKQGVMLAHTFKDPKTGKIKNPPKGTTQAPNGWYLSEKFDGYRAIWDGKDFRSRAGNIFQAPNWFKLWMPPSVVLDGELFLGRECFEQCGLLRKKTPDSEEWVKAGIKYQVFDSPSHKGMFEERQKYIKELIDNLCKTKPNLPPIAKKTKCPLVMTKQIKVKSEEDVMKRFNELVKKGAEGVMLRAPNSPYEATRTSYLLKVKQLFDDECKIIGYKEGTGKYKGMLGAFHCQLVKNPQITFDISGMNDEVRKNYKKSHKVGTIVTFTYMGLTGSGTPRHPNYLRIRKGKN